eukprot:GHUV01001768.1.p1 GENE.GHUV01001768.1~~GHUV01001768.1.p1  ORF type:complete len:313 (+),score=74.73 GHUV01001768.1:240-1178(+)
MSIRSVALLALGCSILLFSTASAMMPGMGMGMGPDKPKAAAIKSDTKFIKCQVCEAVVKQATRRVKAMRSELKPGTKLEESSIIEFLENICSTIKPDGLWITHYDIVEDGDKLKLVDTGSPSKCNTECATIARACSDVTEDLDLSDLSEALFAGKSRSSITQLACYDMSDACKVKPPPVLKDRKPGPAHVPMSEEESKHEEMMAKMKAAGLSGQMYNRDDIMSQMEDLQAMADGGDIPEVPLREVESSDESPVNKVVKPVTEAVAKAGEAVQEAVGQAKEVAAAAVEKASGLFKSTLGKISSSLKGRQEQEL